MNNNICIAYQFINESKALKSMRNLQLTVVISDWQSSTYDVQHVGLHVA